MSGLVLEALTVRVGGRPLVDDVGLEAPTGQLTGLIGPNGAGKSTLIRAILGLVEREAGSVRFEGADLLAMPRRERARIAAFVEQTGTAEAQLTVREVVQLGRIPFQSIWQSTPSTDDARIVEDALSAVDMAPFAARLYHTLSGGEQQRTQIGRALAQQPQLLILDEPTNHLDVSAQLSILQLLHRRARAGGTVLLALHDLNLAAAFCDTLVVLHEGRLVTQGTPEQVLTPALLRQVYGVAATLLQHPTTGRPMIAYDPPPNSD